MMRPFLNTDSHRLPYMRPGRMEGFQVLAISCSGNADVLGLDKFHLHFFGGVVIATNMNV